VLINRQHTQNTFGARTTHYTTTELMMGRVLPVIRTG
jgi:hypothetical protein